ncbi:hypothetical protein SAOR_08835 [Salinisphaera orenii MK-B5]|uniref:Inner membrane protein YgaP-like transmembrane domain-containing protein n=1 Tax=Salinisphaera orenii MK-B5 TaxID=856730 RepID=A0A423PNU6_9GAMM|nr:DUF2892 domain-containing protein [Salinisphaera orenii]ROO27294.1 hypothetical protein SAOR_08835 [Salinisphaera orenii MK-B5]
MGFWEAIALATGAGIVILFLAALRHEEFDAEAPKYEMLGLPVPTRPPRRGSGRLGPTDRIVRLGAIGAAFYYAGHFGWGEPVGLVLALVGLYLSVTGLFGRDPIYYLRDSRSRAG